MAWMKSVDLPSHPLFLLRRDAVLQVQIYGYFRISFFGWNGAVTGDPENLDDP